MKTRGRARQMLCGRVLDRETFDLMFSDVLVRVASRLGSGYELSDEALDAACACGDAMTAGDWAEACCQAAIASDELWATRMTIAAGGVS